jgi:hypothetical protein
MRVKCDERECKRPADVRLLAESITPGAEQKSPVRTLCAQCTAKMHLHLAHVLINELGVFEQDEPSDPT